MPNPLLGNTVLRGRSGHGLRDRSATRPLSPEEEQQILADVASQTSGVLGAVGYALGTPGAMLNNAMVGKNPLDAMFAAPEDRLDGRDVLREKGLVGREDTWGNYLLGMGFEIATDPLSLVSGPASALTKAGRVARSAGLYDDAAKALSRKYLNSRAAGTTASLGPEVASRASAGYKRAIDSGKTMVTDSDLYSKPLVGKRAASKHATLDDVIKYADNPQAAEDSIVKALGKGDAAAGKTALAKIRNQRLSNDIGIGLPLGDASYTADLGAFGNAYRDALDVAGRTARWSPVGRGAAALFDNRTNNQLSEEAQMAGIAAAAKGAARREAATREGISQLSKLNREAPDAFSDDGGRIIGRLIEDDGRNKILKQGDLQFASANPAVREYVQWWDSFRQQVLDESADIGIRSDKLKDQYGHGYMPYQADAMFEMAGKRDKGLSQSLSTMTGDQMKRGTTLRLPGGRDQIMDLSQDTRFSGPKRTLTTDAAAADGLAMEVFQKPYAQLAKGEKRQMDDLARLLHKLPAEATERAPLFGQHPAQQIQQYIEGRATAAGNMDALLDGVASFAVQTPARLASTVGRGNITLADALKRIGARTKKVNGVQVGGKAQLRDRIAKGLGINPNAVSLNQYSVPLERVEALLKSEEVFTDAGTNNAFVQYLDSFTSLWKGSILAWPSRITRDLYSGQISNWLVGAASLDGTVAATDLINNGAKGATFLKSLDALPQYRSLPTMDAKIDAFQADLAATELVSGGSQLDRVGSLTGRDVLDRMPGAVPRSLTGSIAKLRDIPSSLANGDFFRVPSARNPYREMKNPILLAGDEANTVSDQINRLSGYMTLLSKGYDPSAAANTIKRVQVDYKSLSSFERNFLRRALPWYTYQSRIMKEVLGQMAVRPGGRYGTTVQAITEGQDAASQGEDHIPSYLRERIAVPFSENEQGVTYLNSFDGPGWSEFRNLSPSNFFENIGEQLAPQYRIAAEMLSGRDFYHDQPLSQSNSGIASNAYRAATGGELPMGWLADRVISNVPFVSRPARVVSQLLDDRVHESLPERAALAAVDALLGVKLTPVDRSKIDADLSRQLKDSVSDNPYVRTSERPFIPEELQPNAPQWVKDRLQLLSQRSQRKRQKGPTIQ